MMQSILPRAFAGKSSNFICSFNASQSTLAQSALENESLLPKMPPFDYTPPPYSGPSAEEILGKRRQFLSPAVFHFFKNALNLVDGKMQYLFDEKGRRYLDAFGGIATVCCGHCHPEVVDAVVNQTKRLQHSTILYLNPAIAEFAEALAAKFPGDLKVVFFTNSGTEANELALLMARLYTGCHDVISIRNGYHGNAAGTMGATAQSSYKFNVVQTGVHHALNPDQYRGSFGSDGLKYAKDVEDIITYGTSGRVAAFIAEAIQGVGGIMELAPGYLPAVYSTIRKAGGLCIADEVQSGFARTGSHFWGFEAHGVVPARSSMSMTDLVSHLEHRISEQGASNGPNLSSEEWESLQILDDINRCLLSDVQNMPDSDEKSLMARVNSLCCLLQKDINVQSRMDDCPDMSSVQKRATDASDAMGASASEKKDEESYCIVSDHSNDISGQNQTGSMSRKDSVGDLLLNLPRIASLPQFLFNISEDYENQAR